MNQKNRGGVLNTPNVSFVAEDNSVRYLLENTFENGYEWVDLGLPSGLKWATCNVGATSPEKAGLYFAWGETVGYTPEQVTAGERVFDEDTYNADTAASISTNLTLEHDSARVILGGNWRMPTKAEYEELINSSYTSQTWTNDYNSTGVAGRIITSKSNGNYIFLPATGRCIGSSMSYVGSDGFYWSSEWNSSRNAHFLLFSFGTIFTISINSRYFGFSVRGVCE